MLYETRALRAYVEHGIPAWRSYLEGSYGG